MNAPNNNLKVQIWDLGPERPVMPKAPEEPKPGLKAAELALAQVEHEDALASYKQALRDYGVAKKEYERWQTQVGGPVELSMWSVDAADAMERQPGRFVANLPRGLKPGKAHFDNIKREEERQAELARQAERDPQFGKQQGAAA